MLKRWLWSAAHKRTHARTHELVKPLTEVSFIIFNIKIDSEHILPKCTNHFKEDTYTIDPEAKTETAARRLNCVEISSIDFQHMLCFVLSVSYQFFKYDSKDGRLHIIIIIDIIKETSSLFSYIIQKQKIVFDMNHILFSYTSLLFISTLSS